MPFELHIFTVTTKCITVVIMEHKAWIAELLDGDSMRQASKKAGYVQTTLQRQVDKGRLSPEMVIALCRAYDRPAVEGLVQTGYLYPHEVETPGVTLTLPKATNRQLLDEINRRSDPEARHLFTNTDDHDVVDLDDDADVFEFAPRGSTPTVRPQQQNTGIPADAVADSSPEIGGTLDDLDP